MGDATRLCRAQGARTECRQPSGICGQFISHSAHAVSAFGPNISMDIKAMEATAASVVSSIGFTELTFIAGMCLVSVAVPNVNESARFPSVCCLFGDENNTTNYLYNYSNFGTSCVHTLNSANPMIIHV